MEKTDFQPSSILTPNEDATLTALKNAFLGLDFPSFSASRFGEVLYSKIPIFKSQIPKLPLHALDFEICYLDFEFLMSELDLNQYLLSQSEKSLPLDDRTLNFWAFPGANLRGKPDTSEAGH